jgi:hypothetical protein
MMMSMGIPGFKAEDSLDRSGSRRFVCSKKSYDNEYRVTPSMSNTGCLLTAVGILVSVGVGNVAGAVGGVIAGYNGGCLNPPSGGGGGGGDIPSGCHGRCTGRPHGIRG